MNADEIKHMSEFMDYFETVSVSNMDNASEIDLLAEFYGDGFHPSVEDLDDIALAFEQKSDEPELDEGQIYAKEFILEHIANETPVVCLLGAAGCGATYFCIAKRNG